MEETCLKVTVSPSAPGTASSGTGGDPAQHPHAGAPSLAPGVSVAGTALRQLARTLLAPSHAASRGAAAPRPPGPGLGSTTARGQADLGWPTAGDHRHGPVPRLRGSRLAQHRHHRALPGAGAIPAMACAVPASGNIFPAPRTLPTVQPSQGKQAPGPRVVARAVTAHQPTEGDAGHGAGSCRATAAQPRMGTGRTPAVCPHDPCPALRPPHPPGLPRPTLPAPGVGSAAAGAPGDRRGGVEEGVAGGGGEGAGGHSPILARLATRIQAATKQGACTSRHCHRSSSAPAGAAGPGEAAGGCMAPRRSPPLPAAPPRSRPPLASRARGAVPGRPTPPFPRPTPRAPPRPAAPAHPPGTAPGRGTALPTQRIPLRPGPPAPAALPAAPPRSLCPRPLRHPSGPAPAPVPPDPQQPPCLHPAVLCPMPDPCTCPGLRCICLGATCITPVPPVPRQSPCPYPPPLHAPQGPLPRRGPLGPALVPPTPCQSSATCPVPPASPWCPVPSPGDPALPPCALTLSQPSHTHQIPNLPTPPNLSPGPAFCCQPRAPIPAPAAA